MADSYYTVIKGKKYDRRMIELADGLTKGRGDGRISVSDAKTLLRVVKDSNSYSPVEKQTMEYIRKRYKFTKEGDQYFREEIRKWAAGKGKKKTAVKEKKTSARASAPAPVSAASSAIPESPAYNPPPAAESGSPWKEIMLGLLLLIVFSALFYFVAFKTSCGKAMLDKNQKSTEVGQSPAAPAEPAKTEAVKPAETAKPAPEAAKPAAKSEVPADLKGMVEKTQLIFIAERTDLLPTTVKKLDALALRLKNANLRLQLTGHTCSLGPKALNQQISEKRAQVIKEALVARGVPAANIETRGIADAQVIGDQKTVAGRVASRRVTLKVLQ